MDDLVVIRFESEEFPGNPDNFGIDLDRFQDCLRQQIVEELLHARSAQTDEQDSPLMFRQGKGGHHGPGVGEDQIVRIGEIHLGLDGIRAVEPAVEDEPAEAVGGVNNGDELEGASNLVDDPVALAAEEDRQQG